MLAIQKLIAILMIILSFFGSPNDDYKLDLDNICKNNVAIDTEYTEDFGTRDKLHFLNTDSGNCIIVESNGKFAMIDAAEDNDNPRNFPGLQLLGFEDYVVDYLLTNCADENGKVTLEWVLGTHAHSDHIGGFDTIINHNDITVKKAYLKKYDSSRIRNYEVKNWDNEEVYNQMIDACINNNVELCQDFDNEPFVFGDFTIQFFNTEFDCTKLGKNENSNSVATLITKGNRTALLTGDLNYHYGTEVLVANAVGKVDLLQIGHHGYEYSSSPCFIDILKPEAAVVCNRGSAMSYDKVVKYFSKINCPIFATVDNDCVEVYFTDSDKIIITDDIICAYQLS